MANFVITWTITNFHFCWHKTGEWLESPPFNIKLDHETCWRLRLYPRGEDVGEYISCYLFREDGGPKVVNVDFKLFLTVGIIEVGKTVLKRRSFKIHQRYGHARLAPRCLIFSPNAASKNSLDLHIGCVIFNGEIDMYDRSFRMVLTRIEIERIYGTEIFDDDEDLDLYCNDDIEVKPMLEDESLININLSCDNKSLLIYVRPVSCKKIKYAILRITVIKNTGKELPIEYVRSWIGEIKSDISRYALLPEIESCAPDIETSTNKTFLMHYDFEFSIGEKVGKYDSEYSEYYTYLTTHHFPVPQYFNDSIKNVKSAPTALNALEDVYKSQSFVDFCFKSEDESLSVHKAILCARSPILKSIINLDPTAAELISLKRFEGSALIWFLYTDSVVIDSLLFAGELYSIASFLKIKLLKTKCRNFLKDKLDILHLSEILGILSVIGDFSLKSAVENFILTHYDLVLHYINGKILIDAPELHKEIIRLKYKNQKTIQLCDVDFD